VAAIGGVTLERADDVLDAGAAAVVVLSDLLVEPLEGRVRAYLRALDR
jgi:thiamine monophosphate synthase